MRSDVPATSSSDRQRDADVVAAVLAGDIERYADLVERYRDRTLRVAFTLLGNYQDAEDAAQEAFVSAYRGLARFRREAAFSTWLFRIVVNECRDALRRRRGRPVAASEPPAFGEEATDLFESVPDPSVGPREQASQRERSRRLSQAIGALPLAQRTAFVLHHLHGMTLEEVSGVMGCRIGTAKSHLFRATERLRAALAPWLDQEG